MIDLREGLERIFKPFEVINSIAMSALKIIASFSSDSGKKIIEDVAERLEKKDANLLAAMCRELPKLGEVAGELLEEAQK